MDAILSLIACRMEAVAQLALDHAASERDDLRRSQYQAIAANFQNYRASLLAGKLPPIGSGVGLGAARALSEWNFQHDDILSAATEVERLYRTGQE